MKSAKNLSELFPNKLTNWKKFSFKNLKKDQLLILLLAGILLMVIAVPAGKTKEHASSASDGNTGKTVRGTSDGTDEEMYTTYLEDRLSRILSQIEGAGEVKVMITLKSSAEKVLDKDTESDQETVTEEDSQGGTRQSSKASKKENTVYASDSDSTTQGSGSPYDFILRQIKDQMHCHCKFYYAEIRCQMSSGFTDLPDQELSDLLCQFRKFFRLQIFYIICFLNSF